MTLRTSIVGIFLLLFLTATNAFAQLAAVTFVHCSPDPGLAVVDIYVTQSSTVDKVEDVAFQAANNFDNIAIYGDIEVRFSIAPSNSTSISDAVITHAFTPALDKGYVVILSGLADTSGYVKNPSARSIELALEQQEIPIFSGQPNQIGVAFAHAAPDLDPGDAYIRGEGAPLTTALTYGDITQNLAAASRDNSTLDFTRVGSKNNVYGSFQVNFANYQSETVLLILCGFKAPQDNKNSEHSLSLLAVLESGFVIVNPLISGSQKARIQWINNIADPTLPVCDIWIGGGKRVNDLQFQKATPFDTIAAGAPLVVGFAHANSNLYKDTIRTIELPALRPDRQYHFVLGGVIDTTKFSKNPNGSDLSLNVFVAEGAMSKSDSAGKTAVRSAHASGDQASITIEGNSMEFGRNLTYGTIAPAYFYTNPGVETLWVKIDSTNKATEGWVADLSGTNRAVVALASGFVKPASNQNGPAFEIIIVDSNGNTNANLVKVTKDTNVNAVDEDLVPATLWRISPNPARDQFSISVPLTSELQAAHGTILSARVYTSTGILIGFYPMQFNGLHATAAITTSSLANGQYHVVVTTADGANVGSATVMVAR